MAREARALRALPGWCLTQVIQVVEDRVFFSAEENPCRCTTVDGMQSQTTKVPNENICVREGNTVQRIAVADFAVLPRSYMILQGLVAECEVVAEPSPGPGPGPSVFTSCYVRVC